MLSIRFSASILAFAAIVAYLVKKDLSKPTIFKVARLVLVFEGIYWLGLITTAGYSLQAFLGFAITQSIVSKFAVLFVN